MSAQELNLEAAEILLAARDDISREGGWRQGEFGAMFGRDGAVCAEGALRRQAWVYGHGFKARLHAHRALGLQVGALVSRWNDEPERTVEDVMAAMDAAAAHLKGRDTPTPQDA